MTRRADAIREGRLDAEQIVGRTLGKTDVDLLTELDGGLRWARAIFDAMMGDRKVWRYLQRTDASFAWEIELFLDDEAANTELAWLWEDENE